MPEFFTFFDNSVLFWSLLSCLLAQFFKIIFNFFSTGEIRFGIMFETGGMPSSHSALITGATSGIGYELGFDSSIFALSVAVALIVSMTLVVFENQLGFKLQKSINYQKN